jgi:hypothetical protein
LEHLWTFKGNWSLAWLAAWLHKVLLLFFSEYDSRDIKHRYIQKQWPKRASPISAPKHAVLTPLISPENVHLTSLHIKLRLTKINIKTMDQNIAGFGYMKSNFPRQVITKSKNGVFSGHQIRELI